MNVNQCVIVVLTILLLVAVSNRENKLIVQDCTGDVRIERVSPFNAKKT